MSWAASACGREPTTGASSRWAPRAWTATARLLSQPGETVLTSMAIAPAPRPASAPISGAIHTAWAASSSVNMVRTNSAPSAASRGVETDFAPRATATSAAAGERFHTVTAWPALIRCGAMREPIAPRPRKAIALTILPFSISGRRAQDARSQVTTRTYLPTGANLQAVLRGLYLSEPQAANPLTTRLRPDVRSRTAVLKRLQPPLI